MTWREDLQPASFRGVPFEVENDTGKFGRRVEVHEYPQRDKPFAEDLGRATREFTVSAFVIGDDYLQRRDALLEAIEAGGPGTLVHPYYGRLEVNVTDVSVTHSRSNGGMCEFSLAFVESGELSFPAAQDSLGAQTLLEADGLDAVASLDFVDEFSLDGMPSFVTADAFDTISGCLDVVGDYLDGFSYLLANPLGALSDVLSETLSGVLGDLLDVPLGLATAVLGMYDRVGSVLRVPSGLEAVVGGGGVYGRNRNAVVALTQMSIALGARVVVPSSTAPATAQAQRNAAALVVLFQRAALIQAAGMTAAMPMPVYDDAVLVRSSVTVALDEASATASDPVYVAMQTLRAKVHADVTSRLVGSARLLTITPPEVLPALAIAYDRYENPERELELIERNRLRHPGFVPAVPLKVLSI